MFFNPMQLQHAKQPPRDSRIVNVLRHGLSGGILVNVGLLLWARTQFVHLNRSAAEERFDQRHVQWVVSGLTLPLASVEARVIPWLNKRTA